MNLLAINSIECHIIYRIHQWYSQKTTINTPLEYHKCLVSANNRVTRQNLIGIDYTV